MSRICLERRGAVLADQIVRVEAVRQEGELHAEAGLEVRQHGLDRAEGGPAPGRVAVEAEDRLGHHAPQQPHLILGQRRAEGCDGVREARLRQRDDVHVAFDDDHAALVVGRAAGAVGVVEDGALVEERRLRGVEVLGGGIRIQRPSAEGDDPSLQSP